MLIPRNQIKAFGLNRMDISQREGHYPPPAGCSTILGVEFSGHIAAVGSDVSQWKIDDEVMGLAGGVCHDHARGLLPLTIFYPGRVRRVYRRAANACCSKADPIVMGRSSEYSRMLPDWWASTHLSDRLLLMILKPFKP
jgi:threonine dehydrogenase-like Zn-dependent dehydrogenase